VDEDVLTRSEFVPKGHGIEIQSLGGSGSDCCKGKKGDAGE
jgi:hypothetical protein